MQLAGVAEQKPREKQSPISEKPSLLHFCDDRRHLGFLLPLEQHQIAGVRE
jgi:hypothetical protein